MKTQNTTQRNAMENVVNNFDLVIDLTVDKTEPVYLVDETFIKTMFAHQSEQTLQQFKDCLKDTIDFAETFEDVIKRLQHHIYIKRFEMQNATILENVCNEK